jgi:hypothetical protein
LQVVLNEHPAKYGGATDGKKAEKKAGKKKLKNSGAYTTPPATITE